MPTKLLSQKESSTRKRKSSYHGNQNLKSIGTEHEFTPFEISELMRCRKDPIYFIETYCMIISLDLGLINFKLYDCQKKKVHAMLNERKLLIMEPRQNGKTVTAAAAIVWYTLFNESKTVAILAHKGSGAREVLSRYQTMYENLPLWLQQGVKTWNKGDIELENGCKIFTGATVISGIRGKSVNWLYIDEAAIIPNNIAEQFFTSTYPTISSGQTTKILLTSTPLGYNHFWKFWNEAEKKINGFETLFIPYWEIPGRDKKWADEQKKTLTEIKFNQEVLCQFLGSSNTLISGDALARMSSLAPIKTAYDDHMWIYKEPIKDHIYAIICDTAEGIESDSSAFSVIDITSIPYQYVTKFKHNAIPVMLYPNYIYETAKVYNNAWVMIETNDIGRQVADILSQDLEYEQVLYTAQTDKKTILSGGFGARSSIGLKQNKATKRIGCFTIKTLIEEGKIEIFDSDVISEMSTFIGKGSSYQADEGYNDDLMMTLVMFGWMTTNEHFKELTNLDTRKSVVSGVEQQIEDQMIPFGIISTGDIDLDRVEVYNGDLWLDDGVDMIPDELYQYR